VKPSVYLKTTIPSYLASKPSRDLVVAAHQEATRQWWEVRRAAFDLYMSELVVQEIRSGDKAAASRRLQFLVDVHILALTEEVLELAQDLVQGGPIPQKASGDAIHIAAATIYHCDYLVTWNCRHIANAELHRVMRQVVERSGYDLPIICTPEELMGEDEP
jgi:predicted nucleic acid-binding protein